MGVGVEVMMVWIILKIFFELGHLDISLVIRGEDILIGWEIQET